MMISERLHVSLNVRRFYLALGCLILVAWVLLIVWQMSTYAELLSHEVIGSNVFPPMWRLAAFLLSWLLMTVAMMLPGSLPLLNHSIQLVRHRRETSQLTTLTILGYLFPWILFGLLVYLGDSFLHKMVESTLSLAAFSGWIAPAIVLVAGLYQFTPLKRSYMARCLPSHALYLRGCVEKLFGVGALKLGLRLGVFCVGSCWSLMLLMFAVGHHRLDWMLALSGIMAAERLAPWGHRLAWLVGVVLIIWATLWAIASPHSLHSHP